MWRHLPQARCAKGGSVSQKKSHSAAIGDSRSVFLTRRLKWLRIG
jgi:hypothetical protein